MSSYLALPCTKSVTYITLSGHRYSFAIRGNVLTWISFSTSLPTKCGIVLCVREPKIGKPLKFAYKDKNGKIYTVQTSPIIGILK